MDATPPPPRISGSLSAAREHVRRGRLADAEQAYRAALADHPAQVEALRFLAHAALAHGNPAEAVALLRRATNVEPRSGALALDLGIACRAAADHPAARQAFQRAIATGGPPCCVARLFLGSLLEADAQPQPALLQYFRAILDAQAAGRWLSDATTDPGLRSLVQHALVFVARERRKPYVEAFAALRTGASITRVEAALTRYLRETAAAVDGSGRTPRFVNVPDLAPARFVEMPDTELSVANIRRIALLHDEMQAHAHANAAGPGNTISLAGLLGNAAPAAPCVPLYQHGTAVDPARAHAPRLLATLDALPLVRGASLGPDADVVVLAAGQHTGTRFGRSNAWPVTVVTSAQSAPLQLTVGGEVRTLAAGSAATFDPTWTHDLRNTAGSNALATAFECWHPGLTLPERAAFAAMAAIALAFDEQVQALD